MSSFSETSSPIRERAVPQAHTFSSSAISTAYVEKAEVPGMDNGVGSNLSNQFIYDSELAVGVSDEQEPNPMILGSLKIAIYPGQQPFANLAF